jgi:hypothetical protein
MNLSGRIHFEHVVVGDVLWKFFDGDQKPTLIGTVIDKLVNGKGKPVVVLDRLSSLGSDRLTRTAFQRLTIRKQI